MTPSLSRRTFIAAGTVGVVGLGARASSEPIAARNVSFPSTDPDDAQSFVGASHGAIDRVRDMLAQNRGLAKSAWDWGFGDYETAIGAASHVGNIEMIELLLAHGARPDLFTLATLDRVDAVRATLENVPGTRDLKGPHSIPLMSHARAGRADRVIDYLESIGLVGNAPVPLDAAAAAPYLGAYAWGTGQSERFEIAYSDRSSALTLQRPGTSLRNLKPAPGDPLSFSPAGAEHAVIRFDRVSPSPTSLTLSGTGPTLIATRTDA